ncbi:hypothetical protein BDK51DRAFT_53001 [Blyttiomyces helicus]|uniref:Uncharacterized protein n=1 Tax=Blyttiomyces helicus TaxID=388810 RepID=A0A4P9WR74_9FUNG|nr:hypothetical protein BDK51DRAFT_53001 [Blyttiomyces helicus]|eukprot:RKO94713.1 hypothetical protein BDK51DRAFT_53001 [Blyttiomyces helicus]
MDWIPIIAITLIIICVFFAQSSVFETFLPGDANSKETLYRLLSTVKTILESRYITYSITGNILADSISQEKLLNTSSTATILIPYVQIGKFLETITDFLQYGLGVNDLPDGGYKIGAAISAPWASQIAVMVQPVYDVGGQWITKSKIPGVQEVFGTNELFPTKMYKLGELDLPGPLDPVQYLRRNYIFRYKQLDRKKLKLGQQRDKNVCKDYEYYKNLDGKPTTFLEPNNLSK